MHHSTIEYFPLWPYDDALDWMKRAHQIILADPSVVSIGVGSHKESVITLGRDPKKSTIHQALLPPNVLVRRTERGGGATIHEPGQLVLYPVFNLRHWGVSPKILVALLENTAQSFLRNWGIESHTSDGFPGIFVGEKKIGFIGLRIHQSISAHGMALNVFNDAQLYRTIDPCGVNNMPITSLSKQVKLDCTMTEALSLLAEQFLRGLLQYVNCC